MQQREIQIKAGIHKTKLSMVVFEYITHADTSTSQLCVNPPRYICPTDHFIIHGLYIFKIDFKVKSLL